MTLPAAAQHFRVHFKGYAKWPNLPPEAAFPQMKVKAAEVFWSSPHQGKDMHVERYRNSPLMHKDVPDWHKPILFENGERIDFPPPTKRLKEPRVRSSRKKDK